MNTPAIPTTPTAAQLAVLVGQDIAGSLAALPRMQAAASLAGLVAHHAHDLTALIGVGAGVRALVSGLEAQHHAIMALIPPPIVWPTALITSALEGTDHDRNQHTQP